MNIPLDVIISIIVLLLAAGAGWGGAKVAITKCQNCDPLPRAVWDKFVKEDLGEIKTSIALTGQKMDLLIGFKQSSLRGFADQLRQQSETRRDVLIDRLISEPEGMSLDELQEVRTLLRNTMVESEQTPITFVGSRVLHDEAANRVKMRQDGS